VSPARSPPVRLAALRDRPERVVAGLMTGTSVDGIDVAICRVGAGPRPRLLAILGAETVPFAPDLRRRLLEAGGAGAAELARLGRALGEAYADAVEALAARAGVAVELVGSHGQTVYHEHGLTTLQIGEPAFLAWRLGCPVVADFRQNDIAAGGCGAPLVPILDDWLLRRPRERVLTLNLGGISNVTALPPLEARDEPVLGFDCGPANMVLDELAVRFTQGRETCDRDGAFAAAGRVDKALLRELLADPALAQPPPRSLGREQFGAPYVDRLLRRRPPAFRQDWLDLFATATELSARAVAEACAAFVPWREAAAELVAAGGGVRNPELMRRLAAAMAPVPVVASGDAHGLPADFKEAVLFALLASARVDEVPGNLPSVTGAGRPVLLGKVAEC
jgi:anhydro-N-acetylmuramic acid kinase